MAWYGDTTHHLQTMLEKMGKEVDKKTSERYFNKQRIFDVDDDSQALAPFVKVGAVRGRVVSR